MNFRSVLLCCFVTKYSQIVEYIFRLIYSIILRLLERISEEGISVLPGSLFSKTIPYFLQV